MVNLKSWLPNEITNGLIELGYYLAPSEFTYYIPTSSIDYLGTYSAGTEISQGFYTLNSTQINNFKLALKAWDDLIAPDFTLGSVSSASIKIAFTSYDMLGSSGYAYYPYPGFQTGKQADIWLNAADRAANFDKGSFEYQTLLHEIGHTLGLKHSFEGIPLPSAFDNTTFTVMSYSDPTASYVFTFSSNAGTVSYSTAYANDITPMVADIAAIQDLYGADPDTNLGNTIYSFSQSDPSRQAIYDAGGIDTIDLSNYTRPITLDLDDGAYSTLGYYSRAAQTAYWQAMYPQVSSSISSLLSTAIVYTWTDNLGIAIGTDIENANGGSDNDTIFGNELANSTYGNAGNDLLLGRSGDDILNGGLGLDTLSGGTGADHFVFDTVNDNQDVVADYNWSEGDKILMDIAAVNIQISGQDVLLLNYRQFPNPATTLLLNAASDYITVNQFQNGNLSDINTEITFDAANKASWSKQSTYYTFGQISVADYIYDDGRQFVTQYDISNTAPYSKIETYRLASNSYDNQITTYYDDGTKLLVNYYYNYGNMYSMIDEWVYYDTHNRIDSIDQYFNINSHIHINYDQDGSKIWSQDWFAYDALFRLSSEDVYYDDGARTFINVDEAANQAWSQDWFAYDAQGQLSSEDVLYDDGTRTFINLDEAGNQTWSQDWFAYDAQGHLSSEDVFYDDGTRTYINLDENNSQVWSQAWFTYDSQGRLDTQDVFNDDGTRIFTNYDQDNSQTYNVTAFLYDNTGHAYQQVIAWDDGSTSYVNL